MSLPKVISQETFDEVVLENVKEFDMELEEAITDAVKDFEAQGVLLSNIIRQVSLNDNKDRIFHPVMDAVEVMRPLSVDGAAYPTMEQLSNSLATFTKECDGSLAHRVFVTKRGAYQVILDLMKKVKDSSDLVSIVVKAMAALSNGNPDIITKEGVQLMQQLMEQYKTDVSSDAFEHLARWCLTSNTKHERNRQSLFDALMPHSLAGSLNGVSATEHRVRILVTLKAIKSFTLDDDIRAEFGKAHENCRHFVEEEGLIAVSLQITKAAIDSDAGGVAGEGLSTLSSVCVRAEYCKQACDLGALDVINSILLSFGDSATLTKQCISLISTLAGDDNVKIQVMRSATPFLIAKAFDKHQINMGVCSSCCSAVGHLVLRFPKHASEMIQCGAAAGVVQAMKQHVKVLQVQKNGCLAVRNLCCRDPANAAMMQEMQAADAVQEALAEHGEKIKDLAKGALRDMGENVALVEQWHGKGHELEQGD